jgi:hypothetical protein
MRIRDDTAVSLNPSQATSPLYGSAGRAVPTMVSCGSSTRASLESTSMDPDQTVSFDQTAGRGARWLDIEASGPLFRIGQWADELQSTMRRTLGQYATLIGYWPAESAADSILSTVVGLGATAVGVTMGDSSAPPGASASMLGSSTTRVVLSPLDSSTSGGFQTFWSSKVGTMPTPGSPEVIMSWRANALLWTISVETGSFKLRRYLSGALVADDTYTWGGSTVPTDWMAWRAKCYQSGGNIVTELAWFTEDNGVWGVTQTAAGTIDRLTSIRVEGNATVATTRYDHLGATSGTADDLQSSAALQSFLGYTGETAAARFLRLMDEAGITASLVGSADDTQLMGPQRAATLMDLLKEIAATEDALIFDKRDAVELVMRTRRDRYNQDAALALTYGADIAPPLKERLDTSDVQNSVIITDRSGASASKDLTSGPMSTAAYPDGIGVMKGGALPDVEVNVADPAADLPVLVSWYLARGTVTGPRFPSVTVEVGLQSPGLRTAAIAVDIGDRITITGRLPDVIDLQVIGIREEIDTHTWTLTFTCVPNDVFQVGGEEDGLLDAESSTLNASVTSTATTLVFTTPDDPQDTWSTTAEPYDVMIAGERITVTNMGAVTGSGPYTQTATVTRSVNGVVKAQSAGASVHIFNPVREAW